MKQIKNILLSLFLVLTIVLTSGCGSQKPAEVQQSTNDTKIENRVENTVEAKEEAAEPEPEPKPEPKQEVQSQSNDLDSIYNSLPAFSDKPYVVVNSNKAGFSKGDLNLSNGSYDKFTPLDSLGRCGAANAMVGRDIMPTEKRGRIGMVKPSGWQLAKYDIVDGKYLYNRCHLIGFQLTGQNANRENLITGTRYFNVDGMLPFENEIADYVKRTGNHVRYEVVPYFVGNELVARGAFMRAESVEDNGRGVNFNIFAYNNQPGITIDYKNGNNNDTSGNSGTVKKYNNDKVNYDKYKKPASNTGGKVIKGNINSKGEKIYHVPGGAYYERTKPEQTFSTVEEAEAAGFRPSSR